MTQDEIRHFLQGALTLAGVRRASIVFRNGKSMCFDTTGIASEDSLDGFSTAAVLDAVNFTNQTQAEIDGIYAVPKKDLDDYPFFRTLNDVSLITGRSLSCVSDFVNAYVPKFGSRAARYVDVRLYVGHRYKFLQDRKLSVQAEHLDMLITSCGGMDPYDRIRKFMSVYIPFSRHWTEMTVDQIARVLKISQSSMRKIIRSLGVDPVKPKPSARYSEFVQEAAKSLEIKQKASDWRTSTTYGRSRRNWRPPLIPRTTYTETSSATISTEY